MRSGVNRTNIASAAWTRSADSVASVDTRGNVYAFHIRKNRYQLLSREGDEGTAVCCNEKEVFAGFVTGVIKMFDVDKPGETVVATLKGHRSRVTHLELSPNDDLMLSTSNDCALLWDLKSGTYTKKNLSGGAYGAVQARFAGTNGEKAVVALARARERRVLHIAFLSWGLQASNARSARAFAMELLASERIEGDSALCRLKARRRGA